MQEQYKNFWISGHATPGYPAGHNLTPSASVSYQRTDNSLIDLSTMNVHNFTFDDREDAELIGLELARLIVDTCYPELRREQEETERRVSERQSRKSPSRR